MKPIERKLTTKKEKLRHEEKGQRDKEVINKEKARRKQAELFRKFYDKTKIFEFPPINKINMEKHFYFPKFENGFNYLNKSALAVYPILCSKADFEKNNWFQLSRKTISKLGGISETEVRLGIRNVILSRWHFIDKSVNPPITIPYLEQSFKNEGKRHFYTYKVGFVRKELFSKYSKFIFYTCIIDSGVWAELSPRAKALYLAMRNVAKFERELYSQIENEYIDYEEGYETFKEGAPYNEDFYMSYENYRNRKWDVCNASLAELCRSVNIESSNIQAVIRQLTRFGLIEYVNIGLFKVYLKPKIKKMGQ